MKIGYRLGAQGTDVGRLHRVLRRQGLTLDDAEMSREEFGASTLEALHAFQRQHDLSVVDEIDSATLEVLLRIEANISINIYEGGITPAPKPDEHHGRVGGTLVDGDGVPVPEQRIVLFEKQLRSQSPLGEGRTNENGAYRIHYQRRAAINLVVQAYDATEKLIATSATLYAAGAQVTIDFTTAADGIVRVLSVFATLQSNVNAQLQGIALADLKENKDTHDIQFVANSIGVAFANVAYLFMATVLGAKHGLRPETLFGIFYEGIPASLSPALGNLPDDGIDDAFMSQVMTGVLAHSRDSLNLALTTAVGGDLLPASYADAQTAELNILDTLRVQATASTPYVRGKTPVSDLLAAGSVSSAVQTAFLAAFAASGGRLGPTWKVLRANKDLPQADLATLNTTLSVGELLTGNLPLVKDTLQRLSQKSLARISDLALLDQNDWVARITALDPNATSIPQVLPNDTPAQRIARFAKALAERFAGRFPSTAFVGGLTKARSSSFKTRTEIMSVLTANPTLNLKRSNIDQFVSTKKVAISAPALIELKTAQRLFRMSPHYTSVEALNSAGYQSAQSVYFAGRSQFIAQMTQSLGSASLAKMAYARAQMTYATALTLYGRYSLALNTVNVAAAASAAPPPGAIANFPDLQSLFGSQDYFACEDCQSIYSPAAYLVDLLQYLKQFGATPLTGATPPISTISNARDAFLFRRPEVQYIALDCNNTNVTLPYIDLVNEILEAVIAPPSPPPPQPIVIDTTGTSAERRALPQNISAAAYVATQNNVFPLTLPFDLSFAQTSAYLAAMGTSLAAVMTLFAGAASGPSAAAIACARLGINPEMQAVINGTDANQPWQRWGFSVQNNPTVVDPETRTSFIPATWIAALSQAAASAATGGGGVPVLLNRSGLTLQQLYQLLEVVWVSQSLVTLQLGVSGGFVSSSTELMSINGATSDVLDRAQRFLRLQNATGLQMWELDWALGSLPLNDAFLVFIAGAIAVKSQLNLPLQEALSFWSPLQARDVTSQLGDQPTIVPSTYSEVFANPTMLASWSTVFPAAPQPPGAFDLNGNPIIPTEATPTSAQSANLNATTAALGISAADVATILAATPPATPNVLTLASVNVLLRYQRLATALGLSISDLVLWIQLTAATPFGTAPADTLEFLRRLAVLQGTGLGVHDLDYLLRNQSLTQTALVFSPQQSTTLLQAIASAIGKLTPSQQGDAATVSALFIAALATATNVTADVVTPVLNKTGVLPLSSATIQLLLQNTTVDPTLFPQLVNAFTTVAKAAALYTALGASVVEFTFLVQNASSFGWLDPSALPSSSTSPYAAFEALLRSLALDRRQSAFTPKLFDVLGAWLVAGQLPTTVAAAIAGTGTVPSLALALNATVSDTAAIAGALAATAPSLIAATQAGSLADMALLASIAKALDTVARYSVPGTTLVALATASPDAGTAGAAFGAFQAQYPQSSWFGAVQPVEDALRQNRRDALVAYLLGPGANLVPMFVFLTTDDVYDYFLIDPEMCACALSTRLLQASLAIQQFVQQCFLNLSIQVTVNSTAPAWSEWTWRQQYRLWQANREVFLYPENYVLPETRTNASSFFTDMESDLRQASCTEDLTETAFENYMRKLVDVSQLVVAAHYNETTAAGPVVLHVFAHTRGSPWKWYYRTRTTASPGAGGAWSAWEAMNLDIASDQVVPVIWDQRLHIVWLNFKQEAEKQSDQAVPSTGEGGTAPAPINFWSVDVALSELSAGQWQPKTVLAEKMFFVKNLHAAAGQLVDRPKIAFTLRASQDNAFNLVVTVYYSYAPAEILVIGILDRLEHVTFVPTNETAVGTLSMPEAPMKVVQDTGTLSSMFPDSSLIDLAQEPSFSLVQTATLTGTLTTPNGYGFWAQDLIAGSYFSPNTGTVALNVLSQTTSTGSATSIELLGKVINPRIIIPPQEAVFDSLDPFFVVDGGGGSGTSPRPIRTYLVQPEFYTVSSSPQPLENLEYIKQWTTSYEFQSFYHPFARTMLRELEIGGIPQLMSRSLQTNPQSVRGWSTLFDFNAIFQPQPPVAKPYPGQPNAPDVGESGLDFSAGCTGAYSLYNWEVFYHGPMFVASLLGQNQQYQDAMNWYEYIFNPTDSSGGATPQRFWEMAPLFQLNLAGWVSQQIQNILQNLAQGISDPDTTAALNAYLTDPFDPHAIASLRISAYGKATVMMFLSNLIAWGDSLFTTYTAETVGQAEQLYILADMILGPAPNQVLPPPTSATATPATYAQIESELDSFSNDLVAVENLIVAPSPPTQIIEGTGSSPTLPQLPSTLLFCIPPNSQLLAYWSTVADRLYKIRHCMNLQGQVVPLPLYAPPINPLLAAEEAAAGEIPSGLTPPAPIYRFLTYLPKAVELANDVRSFGALILSALEKEDAESLALLRANQELDIQTRMLDVKTKQVTEATDQITALQNQQAISQIRYNFYSTQPLMNAWETQALTLQGQAYQTNSTAIPLDLAAMEANFVPNFSFGAEGFGGSPETTASFGGGNIAGASNAAASAMRAAAGLLTEMGAMVGTLGSYQHRMDDWGLQAQIAQAEISQIGSQITAANDRLAIANSELSIQNQQINNAQTVSTFLTNKYTNAQLYGWMVSQLTTVYTQAYQLAYGLAQQAQSTYQFELGRYQDAFLQPSYWDSQHRGLTAGESLLFDLRRMEAQYLAENARELELTKHISLAITQPMALIQLMETGTCQIYLNEALFDADHPGQYFRRLRSVAVTIPCVTGPYTGVNANLTLTTAVLRITSTLPSAGYVPASAQTPPADVTTFSVTTPTGATISTSSGQNDAGLFEVNLRDERWLPFEGQGAVSAWTLELNPATNNFDFSTITDIVLHVRYTARLGIPASTVLAAIAPPAGVSRAIIVSVQNTFGDALYSFFNPTDTTATQQVLTLPMTNALFPWSNIRSPMVNDISVFFALSKVPAPGTSIATTFGPTGGTANALALNTALPVGWTGTPAALWGDSPVTPPVAPESFTLTVPTASLPPGLTKTVNGQVLLDSTKVEDVILVIRYVS
jgi:Tc toxin complex TcA C-terminal TcB-binding domain/Neuraminidase-like domain/Salmonella virulence plasmid 28.1kDa A protein